MLVNKNANYPLKETSTFGFQIEGSLKNLSVSNSSEEGAPTEIFKSEKVTTSNAV